MKDAPSAADAALFHRATGCPLSRAKDTLAALEPNLRARVLAAAQHGTTSHGLLQDPIELDPSIAMVVMQAHNQAEQLAKQRGIFGRGSCHYVWQEQVRILKENYGISWYSPAQMNPGTHFD